MTADLREQIMRLSVAERIQLMDEIWDSLADDPEAFPLTDEQKAELDRRLADRERNPHQAYSWEEVVEYARKHRK